MVIELAGLPVGGRGVYRVLIWLFLPMAAALEARGCADSGHRLAFPSENEKKNVLLHAKGAMFAASTEYGGELNPL